MTLLDISIFYRIIIGISGMVLLFSSFLVSFVISQRKKLQYHKDLQSLHEQQKKTLEEQNQLLEKKVAERTSELSEQKQALQQSLSELKLAQAQLIQREKMASLGELTAGIAHEIQNPLNFVNNFSEINTELLAEVRDSMAKEKISSDGQAQINGLIQDLSQNLEKIAQHGKRADSIVKGMLQHSRAQSGNRELTDINELCSDYLRLSYQGVRARDKSFQSAIKTEWDDSLPRISIVPQDMGRVLLNLFNNAFYSVNEKKKHAGDAYSPCVTVSSLTRNGQVIIRVHDNGTGISSKILDRIFHPFFTTKPSGQGTGLGLSFSYDIVKAAGGELTVKTTEGEWAEFEVALPGE